MTTKPALKSGFAFRKNPDTGGLSFVRIGLEEHIKQSIKALLFTQKGERRLHSQLGSRVRDLLFRPLNVSLKSELEREVRTAVETGEPRIELRTIKTSVETLGKASMKVEIGYWIKEINKGDSFSFTISP